MKSILLMITFFTRIPIKYPYEYNEEDFIKGIKYIPVVGLLIGVFIYGFSYLKFFVDKGVLVLLLWLFYIWITGGLHMDGLADSFDGLFSNRDKDKILEIMKDSRIGTFGVLSVFFTIMLNTVLLYYLNYKLLILVPVVGRSCAVLSCSISRYAKETGMGKGFVENCGIKEATFASLFTVVTAQFLFNVKTVIPVLLVFMLTFLITRSIEKKIGGMTGDTIGAVIELTQTLFLFTVYLLRGLIL